MKTTFKFNRSEITLDHESALLTGNTYPIRQSIKDKFRGQWDAQRKAWIVNVKETEYWIEKLGYTFGNVDSTTEIKPETRINNGLCPHCHTYCCGDCQSH